MDQKLFIYNSWQEIHTIIDEAIEKRDRSVSIYISGDGDMSVNVYPMYQEGTITFDEFRTKAGLPSSEVKE